MYALLEIWIGYDLESRVCGFRINMILYVYIYFNVFVYVYIVRDMNWL